MAHFQLVVDSISVPTKLSFSWMPLFVVVNPKSGGALGFEVLESFRRVLHPVQVRVHQYLHSIYFFNNLAHLRTNCTVGTQFFF